MPALAWNDNAIPFEGVRITVLEHELMAVLATRDWALLAAVVFGGFLVTWVAMRIVLRETANFSRNYARQDSSRTDSAVPDQSDSMQVSRSEDQDSARDDSRS